MPTIRHIYESMPDVIQVPAEMRRRKAEITISSLDGDETRTTEKGRPQFGNARGQVTMREDFDEPLDTTADKNTMLDKNGYPIGFFEETFGSIPDFPDREPQPPCDAREELE